jgi:hypothetical protein
MKKTICLGIFALIFSSVCLSGCQFYGTERQETWIDCKFLAYTWGNKLNPDIYHPDVGPEGYISYSAYFYTCNINFSYDLSFEYSCTLKDKTGQHLYSYDRKGTYVASPAQSGNSIVFTYSTGETATYTWYTYFQFYGTEIYDLPDLGSTEVTILFHSTDIYV